MVIRAARAVQMQQFRHKHQKGAKRRFTDERKDQAMMIWAGEISLSATAT